MNFRRAIILLVVCLVGICLVVTPAMAKKKPSLDKWKAAFNPKTAKYKAIVSNVSHPVIKGVYTGFAVRDELWKRTNGKIYLDYKPFSMLGGEVEVLNQLQMGAIQGMGVSSVAATNMGPRFGLVNLPFLVNSFDKLDKFAASGKLFEHFMQAMEHQGIIGLDITGYGNYGWATTSPVKTVKEAQKLKFRTAEAAVNQLVYKQWGINPVAMPWPDVPVALKQGVIDGLDHTPMVCNITRKFEVAKYYTYLDYAQGLFIWVFNKAWFNKLPKDLQTTFKAVFQDVAADIRKQTKIQENTQIALASKKGIMFYKLSDDDMSWLQMKGNLAHEKYAVEINKNYPTDKYKPANFLKEVQDYMGYKP